jgi:hypothetical protein
MTSYSKHWNTKFMYIIHNLTNSILEPLYKQFQIKFDYNAWRISQISAHSMNSNDYASPAPYCVVTYQVVNSSSTKWS